MSPELVDYLHLESVLLRARTPDADAALLAAVMANLLARLPAPERAWLDRRSTDEEPARDAPRVGCSFLTIAGRLFHPLDPRADEVTIGEIAWGLSGVNRYGGHLRCDLYSVAQHAVFVSHRVPPAHARWGLLHDAAEGLGLNDMARPVKQFDRMYKAAELRLMRAVARRFGLAWPEPPEVKAADNLALVTEQYHQAAVPAGWRSHLGIEPLREPVVGWPRRVAHDAFLARFRELWPEEPAP